MEKTLPKKVWLVINHVTLPPKRENGEIKKQGSPIEQIFVTTSMKPAKMQAATIIIEIFTKKLEKTRLVNTSPDILVEYYLKMYITHIKKFFKDFYQYDFTLLDEESGDTPQG